MNVPQVTPQDAKRFGANWTINGVSIFMDDAHYKFATDFANQVLFDFVRLMQHQAAEAAKPKVILASS